MDGLVGLLVNQGVGRRSARHIVTLGDQLGNIDLRQQLPGGGQAARLVPTARESRGQGTHLAADQLHTAAMEVAAQIQWGALFAIPGANDNAPTKTGQANRHIKCRGIAGKFIDQIKALHTIGLCQCSGRPQGQRMAAAQ